MKTRLETTARCPAKVTSHRMRVTVLVICGAWLLFGVAPAAAQDHQHGGSGKQPATDPAQSRSTTVEGTLVDAAWFSDEDEGDRVARAAKRLADGNPAALLLGGSRQPRDMLYLLTNSAVLAPYAGATVKVEGQAFDDIRAFRPTALYIRDADKWREVQLKPEQQKSAAQTQAAESAGSGHAGEHAAPGRFEDRTKPAESDSQQESTAPDHHGAKDAGASPEHAVGTQAQGGGKEANTRDGLSHPHGRVLPPAHPLLVNFTAGLFPAAVLADWLGRLLRRKSLSAAGWWMLLFAAVITPFTALAGWMWFREVGDMRHWQMAAHPWLGTFLAIAIPSLAIWRGRIQRRASEVGMAYLVIATVVLAAIAVQGHLGATMSFGSGHETSSAAHRH